MNLWAAQRIDAAWQQRALTFSVRALAFALLVLVVGSTSHVLADAEGGDSLTGDPLTVEDMRALRKGRNRPFEILKIAEEQGVDRGVNDEPDKSLRKIGFSKKQLKRIRELAELGGEEPKSEAAIRRDKLVAEEGIGPDGIAVENNGNPVAEGQPRKFAPGIEGKLQRYDVRVRKILKQSATQAEIHDTAHNRLIAKKPLARRFVPELKRLEKAIAKRFPDPLGSGVDKRAVSIAIFDTRYEYESWVRALFEVLKQEGITISVPDAAKRAMKSESFFFDGLYTTCIADASPTEARHRPIFASGFLSASFVGGRRLPDAIVSGFGNLAETMLYRQPIMTVQSGYLDRTIGTDRRTWPQLVQKQFAEKKIGSIQNVLSYSHASMKLPMYAEAWSLTTLLAKDESEFVKLLVKVNDGGHPFETIKELYKTDDPKLMKRWRGFAKGQ